MIYHVNYVLTPRNLIIFATTNSILLAANVSKNALSVGNNTVEYVIKMGVQNVKDS